MTLSFQHLLAVKHRKLNSRIEMKFSIILANLYVFLYMYTCIITINWGLHWLLPVNDELCPESCESTVSVTQLAGCK